MDHIAHGVLIRGHQPDDRGHRGPLGRGHDDRGPADADWVPAAPPDQLGEALAFLVEQTPCSDGFGHAFPTSSIPCTGRIEGEAISGSASGGHRACRQPVYVSGHRTRERPQSRFIRPGLILGCGAQA
jgi:hypothetical protein